MREATNNQIKQILDEAYSKGTLEKPYSILFVSELDDDVKDEIEEWCSGHSAYFGSASYYYEKDEDGNYVKTNNYGFDINIRNHDVVFQRFELGCHNGTTWKDNEHKVFKELINKTGEVVDKELKLAIYSVLYPLWSGNSPIFGEEDYSMFDEVIHLKMDIDDFKDNFVKWINELIKNSKKPEVFERQKEFGLFILNHPKFNFIPIEETGINSEIAYGNKTNHFCSVDFYKCLMLIRGKTDLTHLDKEVDDLYIDDGGRGKEMLKLIVEDYKKSKLK